MNVLSERNWVILRNKTTGMYYSRARNGFNESHAEDAERITDDTVLAVIRYTYCNFECVSVNGGVR